MLDLLVAGGGPAGLVTALHARAAGLSTAVLEPRHTPIDKACGEGLMPGAVAALRRLGVDVGGWPFAGITYHADGRSVAAAFRRGSGLGVQRTELSARLHEAAVAAGVDIVARAAGEVRQDAESVSAAGLRARYLAAADGLHSPIRRGLGLDPAPAPARRYGLRAHFACSPWTDHVEVHWADDAEAYVTPVAAGCVGVAVLGGPGASFARRLAAFPDLRARLPAEPLERPRAAGPLRQDVTRRVAGRVLLVGDAAGYVDALTGEGLAIAFRCAEALTARVRADRPAAYERDYRKIARRYRLLTLALLHASQRPAVRRRLVPAATRAPWLFDLAVNALAH
ncbi:NAD(P)/FAD-dependent oxidoreductase [uncultured Jatrophihabitans sp.]|uniref:NAD(P)/FAD-dependent oxidoreductase n=1 Tax=uncultured Jatrophihabitans sp. TaxID=1610747 RepID=UPI0035C9D2F5